MSRRRSGYFRHGIEREIPKVHELVLMDDGDALSMWLDRHPEDIENRFRLKTPLLIAIKHDAYECFQVLLQRDANLEEYNPQNETALLIAVRLNRTRMVDDLIARDASILPEDRMARTVTEILISRDDVETLKLLHIQRGNLLDHDLHNEEFY
jgi:ankyrin repeat protein